LSARNLRINLMTDCGCHFAPAAIGICREFNAHRYSPGGEA